MTTVVAPAGPAPAGPGLGVPRARRLADVLAAPARMASGTEELGALRCRVADDLEALAGDLPDGERLQLDGHRLLLAHRSPERCREPEPPFAPSPRGCRRAVGVAAVARCVRGAGCAPAAAVAGVLAEAVADLEEPGGPARAPWWARWYAGLPAGGRAVVQAEAVAWATRLVTAVEWGRFERPPVVGGRDDWWQSRGAVLTLRGRAEVRVASHQRVALLVVGSRTCGEDWRLELGYPGLVATLVRA
ncbi:MAG TPA: hypothetical protein VMB72_03335, partial [Acidimicrobiales bacterium]|nr:hypothetical protein [Acidimicrobiales bacterium]